MEGPGEEEEPEQDPTVEPEAEAAGSAAQPPSGRVIADFITSPEGVKTGWEVRGIHAKYTPAKVDPKAPWRKQVKKQIWGQVKKHPEPKSGFRLRSRVSLQYRKLKDLVRLQKKQGVITEDLRRRIKDFGKERPPQEIKEEREEQKVRNRERRAKKKSEAADTADEKEEEEESLSEEETSVRLKERSRTSEPRYKPWPSSLGSSFGTQSPNHHPGQSASPESADRELEAGKSIPSEEDCG